MSPLTDRCVLVVEDEYYLARDVKQTLTRAGARVLGPFPDKPEALAALQAERPDCAILDVNLGDGADFEIADALQAHGVPFLFFTGYDREMIPARFQGVTRLEKPTDTPHLVRAAEAVCQGLDQAEP